MPSQVLFVADRPGVDLFPGTEPRAMTAWVLEVPDGVDAMQFCADFAAEQNFPIDTIAYVVTDMAQAPKFQLVRTWTAL